MNFKDKIVLVTGSSRGIGKEIALAFAKNGATVIINAHSNSDDLQNTLNEIKQFSNKSIAILKDVSSPRDAREMYEIINQNFSHVDILINNVGISNYNLLTDLSFEEWQKIINTNLNSTFYMTKLCLPKMISNKSGCIINISSIWGKYGAANEVAYSTSKGGMNSFTKALAKEVGLSNIRVNSISCGMINTSMNSNLSDEEIHSFLYNHTMLNKIGTTSDVSNLAMFLASEDASYITGQIINLDGGFC